MPRKKSRRVREAKPAYAANEQVVSATEFKARCLELIDQIQQTRREIIVTRYGKPVAMLSPIAHERSSAWGWMRGTVTDMGDIISPIGVKWNAGEP